MKKRLSILLALALMLGLLCGCGNAKSEAAYDMAAAGEANYYATAESKAVYDSGWVQTAPAEAPSAPMPAPENRETQTGSNLPANVKLIYRANIELESTEFDTAVSGLNELVSKMGGYFEQSELNNYEGRYRHGYYTVRVPAENFDAFCEGVGSLCKLNNISRSAEDVSEAYYDLESRLATQQTKLERLQSLLKKADVMEDIIELESAISDTELTIEQLTGSLRKYDSLVGYSTVSIYLSEVYKLTVVEEPAIGFGAKLAAAFKSGTSRFVDNLGDFVIGFARGWVGWLIFLAIVAVIVLLVRRGVRRGRARRGESVKPARRRRNAAADRTAPEKITAPESGEPKEE